MLAPEWQKAAKALQGVVKVGAVDMDQHQSVGGPYNVRGFPTIKIFGANKKSPKEYNGQRTAQSIVDEALAEVKNIVKWVFVVMRENLLYEWVRRKDTETYKDW